jgi:hypothetical protein
MGCFSSSGCQAKNAGVLFLFCYDIWKTNKEQEEITHEFKSTPINPKTGAACLGGEPQRRTIYC